jgi:predicted dehydrogenase
MLNIPFAHSIDGLLNVLGTTFETVSGRLWQARETIRIEETGVEIPMTVADQVMVSGRLSNGAAISAHFRGGISRGTNFHVEINGTIGDLIVTAPVGYVGIGDFRLQGARLDNILTDLPIPGSYGSDRFSAGPSQSVAVAYERLASDILVGTKLSPTFDDAVALHRLVRSIEESSAEAQSRLA